MKDWLFEVDGRSRRKGRSKSPESYGQSEGIAHVNAERIFTYADEGFLDFFGYDYAAEVVNQGWKVVYEEELDRLQSQVLPELDEGSTWKGEVTGIGKNGTEVPHQLFLTKTADGGIICEIRERNSREEVKIIEEKWTNKLMALREGLSNLKESPTKYDIYNAALEVLRNALELDFCTMNLDDDELCLVKGNTEDLTTSECDLYGCIEKLSKKARKKGEIISGNQLSKLAGTDLAINTDYSYISVPINEIGVVQVFSSGKNSFTEVDRGLMEIMGNHLYERLIRAQLEGDLKNQAIHDQLTGLYNRHFLDKVLAEEVERSRRYGHSLTFLMIDINKFKDVNDRYSHSTGDQVLVQIGEIFEENVREPDTVIRYGGDEFLILMPETGDGSGVVIQRLKDETQSWSQETDLIDFPLTLAIGSATYDPGGEQTADQVIQEADSEMYKDKRNR